MLLIPQIFYPSVTRRLIVSLIGLVLLGPLAPGSRAGAAEPVRFSVNIERRKVDPAQQTLRAAQGSAVELAFMADEPMELHLHGYDRQVLVRPGSVAVIRLDARIAGRFPIEAHRFGGEGRRHVVLVYLEILPR